MKDFRTIVPKTPSENKISYQSPVLFLGSCFTENIGFKMQELKFPVVINPFGVLYNPASVKKGLEMLLEKKEFKADDLNFYNELWFSFYHDTEFSGTEPQESLDKINAAIQNGSEQLKKAKYLIVTFGTAWVYRYKETGEIVSNCHKIPAKEFERFRLEPEEIFTNWKNLIYALKKFNPDLKIIFTVSPVRHWKDGAVENQLSKSTLILSIHQLKKEFQHVEYFPAYEIMMDDLRDYRFYADDMLHPSKLAIDYIWEHFSSIYFEQETHEIIKEVQKIVLAKKHKVFNQETVAYKKFVKANLDKIYELSKKYNFLNFATEENYFKET